MKVLYFLLTVMPSNVGPMGTQQYRPVRNEAGDFVVVDGLSRPPRPERPPPPPFLNHDNAADRDESNQTEDGEQKQEQQDSKLFTETHSLFLVTLWCLSLGGRG